MNEARDELEGRVAMILLASDGTVPLIDTELDFDSVVRVLTLQLKQVTDALATARRKHEAGVPFGELTLRLYASGGAEHRMVLDPHDDVIPERSPASRLAAYCWYAGNRGRWKLLNKMCQRLDEAIAEVP